MPWATLWMRGWLGEGKNTEEENGRQSVRGCMGGGGGGREKAGRRVFGREIKERWSMNFLDLLILNFFPPFYLISLIGISEVIRRSELDQLSVFKSN